MDEPTEIEVLKQRLNDTQALYETLKNEVLLEREVSQELARRNDCLQKDLFGSEEQMRAARLTAVGLESAVKSLSDQIEIANLISEDAFVVSDIKYSVQKCLETSQVLQRSLLTRVELAVEAERAEQAALEAARLAREAEEASRKAEKQAQLQPVLSYAAVAAHASADDTNTNTADTVLTTNTTLTPPTPIPAAAPAVNPTTTEEEASQEDTLAQSSDGEEHSRGRTASTAGSTRPRNMSIGGRRNSSIFVSLPTLAGTSLIRRSSEVMSHNMSVNVGSGESDMDLPQDDPLQALHLPLVQSPIAHNKDDVHESFMDESTDISMDLNVSRFPQNDSAFAYENELETSACADVALFEHFIVVGASEQVAIEFAHQLQLSYDENTLSTMFKNTFGGFFNANRFNNNNNTTTTANTNTTSNTANSASAANAAAKKVVVLPKVEEVKSEKIITEVVKDKRMSFGRNPPPPLTPPTVTTTATTANTTSTSATTAAGANATGTVETTPVRGSGVFSYFMRSPSGTNQTATTNTTTTTTSSTTCTPIDTASVSKKTPFSPPLSQKGSFLAQNGLKGQDLDTISEAEERVFSQPKIIVPSRGFIYGDDTSEHGSVASNSGNSVGGSNSNSVSRSNSVNGSSHASSELLAAVDTFAPSVPGSVSTGPLKSSVVRSGSANSNGTPVDSAFTATTPTTTTSGVVHTPPLPHNLTTMMDMEHTISPDTTTTTHPTTTTTTTTTTNNPPSPNANWMQGFNITEIDTDTDFDAFGHSKVFSSDPISPISGIDLVTQASMKDNNTMQGTFNTSDTTTTSANPGHLPPPQSYYNMMSAFYRSTSNTSTTSTNSAPPVPPVAPVDSPPKLHTDNTNTSNNKYYEQGSTKSTATDDSDGYFSPTKQHTNTTNIALHKPEDVFVRGRIRSTRVEGHTTTTTTNNHSEPPSPQKRTTSTDNSTHGTSVHGSSVHGSSVHGSGSATNIPSIQYTPNPDAASRITTSDKKAGTATTQAEILYRYPYTVEPPPTEVSDFCMPLGGKIAKLADIDSGTMVQEILFGHSHSKRSSRCFIFLLEDKARGEDGCGDEETGRGTNKLYGVCVLHPRLVKTPIQNTKRKNPLEINKGNHNNVVDMSTHGSYNGTAGLVAESEYIEFESMVCYAFLTRFPLFDFFFQVIFDLINTERLTRLELAAEHTDSDLLYSRSIYEYLPTSVLEEVLARLTKLPPPGYGEKFQFHISPGIKPIESVRVPPPADFSEHYLNSSEWALPTLLSWMPVETIVWALSLLLGEAKIVVIGHDYGMVSCAVIGLLVLLRPLDWVSPVIPMLPTKLMDFVESPVPILVGITISSRDQTVTVEGIFSKNSDPSNDGLVLAVLDVSKRELFMDIEDKPLITSLCMPGADALSRSIKDCLQDKTGTVTINSHTHARPKPVYTASVAQKLKTRAAHDLMTRHIRSVAAQAVAHQQKLLDRRRLVVEMANRMSSPNPHASNTSAINTNRFSANLTNTNINTTNNGATTTNNPTSNNNNTSTVPTLERLASFGSADNDLSDDEEEVSRKELPFGHARTSSAASTTSATSANSASSNNLNTLLNSPTPANNTTSTTTTSNTVTIVNTTAPTQTAAASISAAFGKVLRNRNETNNTIDTIKTNAIAPVAVNAAKMVDAAKNALQIPPQAQGKLVHMSKMPLEGNNTEEFLNRFILTQIFSEHMYRQGVIDKPAPPVPAYPAPPVQTQVPVQVPAPPAAPLGSPPTSYAAAVSGVNTHPTTYADVAALNVEVPHMNTDLSPESVGNRKSVRMSGQFSPLSDNSAHDTHTHTSTDVYNAASTPKNDIELRRRSVDMEFRKTGKELDGRSHGGQDESSEDEEEEE